MIYYLVVHCVVQPIGPVSFTEEMDLKLSLKGDRIRIEEKQSHK